MMALTEIETGGFLAGLEPECEQRLGLGPVLVLVTGLEIVSSYGCCPSAD